jgi:hypothetical protein
MGAGQAGKQAEQQAVYANRRGRRGENGKSLLRRRGELVERSFAHYYETGGRRRCHPRTRKHSEAATDPRGHVPSLPPHLRRTKASALKLKASSAFSPFPWCPLGIFSSLTA